MDLAYYYELWRGMMLSADPAVADAVAWWQEFYVKFYMAFIEADRWKQYLDGIVRSSATPLRCRSGAGPLATTLWRPALPKRSQFPSFHPLLCIAEDGYPVRMDQKQQICHWCMELIPVVLHTRLLLL